MKRLSVDIEDNKHAFIKALPWGYRCEFVRAIVSMATTFISQNGTESIAKIIQGKCEIKYKEK